MRKNECDLGEAEFPGLLICFMRYVTKEGNEVMARKVECEGQKYVRDLHICRSSRGYFQLLRC